MTHSIHTSRIAFCFRWLVGLLLLLGVTSCRTHKRGSVPEWDGAELVGAHRGELGGRVAEEALTWLGTPYVYAGQAKGKGTDCSGMVKTVYAEVAGFELPRNSARQADYCRPLVASEVEVGDLVFFATGSDPDRVSHVGIMLDGGRFIHASSSKGVVVSQLDTPYYRRTWRKYGRVPGFEPGSKTGGEVKVKKGEGEKDGKGKVSVRRRRRR